MVAEPSNAIALALFAAQLANGKWLLKNATLPTIPVLRLIRPPRYPFRTISAVFDDDSGPIR
jgi:hypothetical protein